MLQALRPIKNKRTIRRLLAAAFVLIAFVEIGSHALTESRDQYGSEGATWCAKYHYQNSGVDCPHKRDHRGPDKNAFDETSHHAALLGTLDLEIVSVTYRSQIITERDVRPISRTLEPPYQPPRQS